MKTHHLYALPLITVLACGTAMASQQNDRDESLVDTVPLSLGDTQATQSEEESEGESSSNSGEGSEVFLSEGESPEQGMIVVARPVLVEEVQQPRQSMDEQRPVSSQQEDASTLNGWQSLTGEARAKWIAFRAKIGEYQGDNQFDMDPQALQAAIDARGPVIHTINPAEEEQALNLSAIKALLDADEEEDLRAALARSEVWKSGPSADATAASESNLDTGHNDNNAGVALQAPLSEASASDEALPALEDIEVANANSSATEQDQVESSEE